jgi:hypothetical protein
MKMSTKVLISVFVLASFIFMAGSSDLFSKTGKPQGSVDSETNFYREILNNELLVKEIAGCNEKVKALPSSYSFDLDFLNDPDSDWKLTDMINFINDTECFPEQGLFYFAIRSKKPLFDVLRKTFSALGLGKIYSFIAKTNVNGFNEYIYYVKVAFPQTILKIAADLNDVTGISFLPKGVIKDMALIIKIQDKMPLKYQVSDVSLENDLLFRLVNDNKIDFYLTTDDLKDKNRILEFCEIMCQSGECSERDRISRFAQLAKAPNVDYQMSAVSIEIRFYLWSGIVSGMGAKLKPSDIAIVGERNSELLFRN